MNLLATLTDDRPVDAAVTALGHRIERHGRLIAQLAVRAAADPTLRACGDATEELAERLFVDLLLSRRGDLRGLTPRQAVTASFGTILSTAEWQLVLRSAGVRAPVRHVSDVPAPPARSAEDPR